MGQKFNPIGLRLGVNRTWDSRWYASKKEYGKLLHEDIKIRAYLQDRAQAGRRVSHRDRASAQEVPRHDPLGASRRRDRQEGRRHREAAQDDLGADGLAKSINIVEIRKPEIDAQLVADNIAQQLERRVAFRRAMKRAVQSAMRLGAEGIRINCTGRLGGAEIARVEWYREGRVPLHTLRADIDYGVATAKTTYGTCGVKVWIFKGEIMEHDPMAQDKTSGGRRRSGSPGRDAPRPQANAEGRA